VNILKLAVGKI
jgi:hypothetical protein